MLFQAVYSYKAPFKMTTAVISLLQKALILKLKKNDTDTILILLKMEISILILY